jgi:Ala-tRNA(Pro) deacylase
MVARRRRKEQIHYHFWMSLIETVMSIPARLSSYLHQEGARFAVRVHRHSQSSAESARVARVPPHQLAKSVIVEDDGGCVMAFLPADRHIKLGQLSRLLGRPHLRLADEKRIAAIFTDCGPGAVPALGMAWGLETVVEDELDDCAVVYIEAGDHERLVCFSHEQFELLMQPARHGQFGALPTH